jgi:DNA-binding phage protein
MTQADAIKGLRRAAKQRAQANAAHRQATDELRRHCHEAQKAGISITQIAREAGLSRQGVYDLLDQRPSPRS